jgi:hypothetical protein
MFPLLFADFMVRTPFRSISDRAKPVAVTADVGYFSASQVNDPRVAEPEAGAEAEPVDPPVETEPAKEEMKPWNITEKIAPKIQDSSAARHQPPHARPAVPDLAFGLPPSRTISGRLRCGL